MLNGMKNINFQRREMKKRRTNGERSIERIALAEGKEGQNNYNYNYNWSSIFPKIS